MAAKVKFLIVLVMSFSLYYMTTHQMGKLPPLVKILNPFNGLWKNYQPRRSGELLTNYISEEVIVQRDQYAIPHIFAKNEKDLFFAQGYVHAQDRLFQMDLQTRAGAGMISELVGKKAIPLDQFFIKMGVRESAEKSLAEMMKSEKIKNAIEAYSAGVNHYISGLTQETLPAEYKLLNAWPQKFQPIRVAYLLKAMTFMLAGKSFDLELTRLMKKYGREKIDQLFPSHPFNISPIISDKELSSDLKGQNQIYEDNNFVSVFADYPDFLSRVAFAGSGDGFKGSNNWALAKQKTKNNKVILANDTHLKFTLPALWYQMQLVVPGMNVYGASFAGAPSILIGHNNHIAWGVTNATLDVLDWYEVEFRDTNYDEYLFAGEWRRTNKTQQILKVKNGEDIKIELIWTHQGVVVETKGKLGLVAQWIAHKPSNDLKTFYDLNHAENFNECKKAVASYVGPAQNFICADSENINILHNGLMPKKKIGQGKYILDGRKKISDWNEYIEKSEMPQVDNPTSGFVRSANQHPTSEGYKNYLGWYYDDSYRSSRISEVLSSRNDFTTDDMRELQNDVQDKFVQEVLPILLKELDQFSISSEQKNFIKKIRVWDQKIEAHSSEASFFYVWWRRLRDRIWSDQLWEKGRKILPQRSKTVEVILDIQKNGLRAKPIHLEFLDDIKTDQKESLQGLVQESFLKSWEELNKKYGEPRDWLWSKINPTSLEHLAKIPSFSSELLSASGSLNTVNANKGTHGAAWRMVVELGGKFRAWAIFPGGISGNPFVAEYEKFVPSWRDGQLLEVKYWLQPQKNDHLEKLTIRRRP